MKSNHRRILALFCLGAVTVVRAGSLSDVRSKLVGVWGSSRLQVADASFSGVTNLTWNVYDVVNLGENREEPFAVRIDGEFWVTRTNGVVTLLPQCVPIILASNKLSIGPYDYGYQFDCVISNDTLRLEDRSSSPMRQVIMVRTTTRPPSPRKALPPLLSLNLKLSEELVGSWEGRAFTSSISEFLEVTNVSLVVYSVGVISSNGGGALSAQLKANLVAQVWDGSWRKAVHSSPVELNVPIDRLRFGIPPDGYVLNFKAKGDRMVLERNVTGDSLEARLQRVRRWPKQPTFEADVK